MHPNTHDMMRLFNGLQSAYGVYKVSQQLTPAGKVKGTAKTVNGPVTVELWAAHLSGQQALGIVPVNEKGTCRFGAIDVDVYPLNVKELNVKIQLRKLPLVLCRTKSGGAHLYLFLSEDTNAEFVIKRLKEMAAALGYGKSEVFPKQSQLLVERGDVGSWINMPYLGSDKTTRYALDDCGVQLSLDQFVAYATSKLLSAGALAGLSLSEEEPLVDGPPCLQHLCKEGFPEGTRNSGLFNLGIYARKATPDSWKAKLEDLNNRFMSPPLSATEVLGVIKSLEKHDYNYTCKTQPIEAHCNADKCRRCKFGVGKGDFGMPKFGSLTKLETKPPIWFIDIEGGHRLELSTEELQSPVRFQAKCMEVLNVVSGIPKREDWCDILQTLFENVNVVEVPQHATPRGHLLALFEEFICSRVQARTKEELILGKPLTTEGFTYFRMKDLIRFLDRQRFTLFGLSEIISILRDEHNIRDHRFRIAGKVIACMKVTAATTADIEAKDLPGLPEDQDAV